MKRPWSRLLIDYGPVLLMMGIIFTASTSAGTSAHSGRLIEAVLSWLGLERRLTPAGLEVVNHYVRKAGHVTEYALLAGLAHRAVARRSFGRVRKRWGVRTLLGVLAFVALYAATDEFHQRFVATRTPSLWDVLLDVAGGSLGLAIKGGWEQWRWRRSG